MKTFIYTYSEKDRKRQGIWTCYKTVRIYWMRRGAPVFVATATESFVDQWQLFLMCAESAKLMPPRAFVRGPHGGYAHNRYELEDKGIARVYQVS